MLFDPGGYGPAAERAMFWSRERIETDHLTVPLKRWDFFGDSPLTHVEGDFVFVHGSTSFPTDEAVYPEDVYNHRKMERIFSLFEQYCFLAHTHLPGIFTQDLSFISPEDIDSRYKLGSEKVLINVGSVGLPADNDERACYVVLEGDTVHFHRVEYDTKRTAEKIREIQDLDDRIADRLQGGAWDPDCPDLGFGLGLG
jgi:diadenosine tetraphosphatase ApaH/serine/threonine PP2A family protein phosphatase